ncbi:EboA domain-containing protein [Fulvivirgaceae bacterium BMA10]|uniref:EboA domain-containing protein n=1 Tax=Splendidivirga corallicola TaxID=3051826 RepID=A0ABT8KJT4_9BACT|nr:EboA domain-containing protein [Fulvivirgaceae bacterium BMA10]
MGTEQQKIKSYLYQLIIKNLPSKSKSWLDGKLELLEKENSERSLYLAFSSTARFIGKEDLITDEKSLEEADQLRPGFYPKHWTKEQATRVLLLISYNHNSADHFVEILEKLFSTSDMGEQTALYAGLPIFPYPERYIQRATEGIRTNITSIFDAVALDNPYPAEYFDDNAWNQMFLKAVFIDRPLYRIQGISKRANAELARIISDFAHERWAAGRIVTPEIWRPVGGFADERLLGDIKKLLSNEDIMQQEAAALVCSQTDHAETKVLLNGYQSLKQTVENGELNWDTLAQKWWAKKTQ